MTGFQAGAFPDCVYEVEKAGLAPGETLVAYTDGVYEAANDTRQRYTRARLQSILQKPADAAGGLIKTIVDDLHEHVGETTPSDDVTILAIRRLTAG